MNNELSRIAIMAVTGGVIAGVSFLAGKKEGSKILKKHIETVTKVSWGMGFVDGFTGAMEQVKFEKDNQEGK